MIRKAYRYLLHWENWHWFAKYIVIGPAWLWFCIKAKSFWFFTSSNPTITFGGFTGETKSEIYRQLPASSYPKTLCVAPYYTIPRLMRKMERCQLTFPVAVKPDAGMMGFMFRKIDSQAQLEQYHSVMRVNYVIQEWVSFPIEVSVFYYRFPGERTGQITGFLKKEMMTVMGDGVQSLRELIAGYPRAQFRLEELFSKHESKLGEVIPRGEEYILSSALNLSRGGKLISLEHEKDERLLEVFDRLSNHSNNFFYGRYDIKCESIEALKRGENFSILEFNGCGAEPHHVYGNGNSFFTACKILIDHWRILYRISMMNRKRGFSPWSFVDGLRFTARAKRHFSRLQKLDAAFELDKKSQRVAGRMIIQPAVRELSNPIMNQKSLA
jgi:hypothetical protein